MRQPLCEPVPGIVAHCALLGRCSERVRDALGRPLVIGRKGDADMAVVEDGVMLAVRLLNLVEALGDQKGSNAVTGHEGEAGFEEIQRSEEHTSELQSLMRISYAGFCLT